MMAMTSRNNIISHRLLPLLALFAILALAMPAGAASAKKTQRSFTTPEEAVKALVTALQENNNKELAAIFGPGSQSLISSGDPVADKAGRERFVKLYDEKSVIEGADTGKAVLSVGNQGYPLPIPMVKRGNAWLFDTKAGKEELLNRRIGKNELNVIEVLRAYVDAQRDYAGEDRDGNGVLEFAQKLSSTPGRKDGLYWEAKAGEEESPFGPFVAKAAQEGYALGKAKKPQPFHGYYFKILKAQGKHAEGGAFDYVVNGKMILGFALIAYPVTYRSSGVMSFIVNQSGVVYQKDLGKNTAKIAAAMKLYDPDTSWKKVE